MRDLSHWSDEPCLTEGRGRREHHGYYQVYLGRSAEGGQRMQMRHRWAWEQANGPIPEGMCVCHHCDNPPCYQLSHLFLGTHAENMADRDSKGRTARLSGDRGSATKVTDAQVAEIRRRFDGTLATTSALAAEFGVARNTLLGIARGTRRTDVDYPASVAPINAEHGQCRRGHVMDDANTYRPPGGGRRCRTCDRERRRCRGKNTETR